MKPAQKMLVATQWCYGDKGVPMTSRAYARLCALVALSASVFIAIGLAPTDFAAAQEPVAQRPSESANEAPPPETSSEGISFQLVGQLGGDVRSVEVQSGIAYAGVGPRLVILDVADRGNPVPLGESDILPAIVQSIALVEGYAYVSAELSAHLRCQ